MKYKETHSQSLIFNIQSIDSWGGKQIDVLANVNSMPEMSDDTVENYLNSAIFLIAYSFVYNHEVHSKINGIYQTLVLEIVGRVERINKVSRNILWVRKWLC